MSSPAYILRKISDQESRPTILYDEIDAVFGPGARGNEDLRAMVNAGYRRGATIGRCNTEHGKVIPQELATYGAIAFGGLGDLPGTIMSRSIIIRMRKRMRGEAVEPFRPSQHELDGQLLYDELAAWVATVVDKAHNIEPVMPAGIADRDADVWMPLLAVGELAGGPWPDMARDTALKFVQSANEGKAPSLGVQLVVDAYQASQINARKLRRSAYDQLMAAGTLTSIGDQHLLDIAETYYQGLKVLDDGNERLPPYRERVRRELPYEVVSSIRERCDDRTSESHGVVIFRLPTKCSLMLDAPTIERAVNQVRSSPGIDRDLSRYIVDIDQRLDNFEGSDRRGRQFRDALEHANRNGQ
jgi:hypothetical protein